MPAPTTTDAFLEIVRKSELVDAHALDAYLDSRGGSEIPVEPPKIAKLLIKDGLLTRFQAEQLLNGKYKPFILCGKYKLLERLGVGGMGFVYLCDQLVLGRPVAIKVLSTVHADSPGAVERFRREARAAASLDHPNIVRVHDLDRDGAMTFLVMEYVDGPGFDEIVAARGPLAVRRAAHYIAQAALGLQHAHERGLVHRDVKPSNLLVDRSGVVKILDLGLARFRNEEADELTRKHGGKSVLGTADYVAPEQALDSHAADCRADIYSLGCTFYYLLTGAAPFSECKSLGQKLMAHQTREPQRVRDRRAEVPIGLAAVLARMLAKKPADRYQTPAEVYHALKPFTGSTAFPPAEDEMRQFCPAVKSTGSTVTSRHLSRSSVKLESDGEYVSASSTPAPARSRSPECAPSARGGSQPSASIAPQPSSGRRLLWAAALLGILAAGVCGFFLR